MFILSSKLHKIRQDKGKTFHNNNSGEKKKKNTASNQKFKRNIRV